MLGGREAVRLAETAVIEARTWISKEKLNVEQHQEYVVLVQPEKCWIEP